MTGANLLAHCLRHEGTELAFGIPGTGTAALLDAMAAAGVRPVLAHSASAACWMAAAYGAITRRPGLAFAGGRAAATDMLTALAACTADGLPAVALLTASQPVDGGARGPAGLDLAPALRPFCKEAVSVPFPAAIPDRVRAAYRAADRDKPGAAAVVVADDVLHASAAAAAPLPLQRTFRPQPHPAAVEAAARVIAGAQRPVLVVGHGALRAGAHQELLALAERGGLPVVTASQGKAAFPHDHPLYVCSGGNRDAAPPAAVLAEADLVVAAGLDDAEWAPARWHRPGCPVVHVHPAPADPSAHYQPVLEVVGDVQGALAALAAALPPADRSEWRRGAPARVSGALAAAWQQAVQDTRFPLHPGRLVAALRGALRSQDLLTVDVGAHQVWAERLYPVMQPGTFWTSASFAAMGFAIPAAIGLACALGGSPNHRVVALTGEGGFLQQAAELETAARLGLPLTVVVACDGGYSLPVPVRLGDMAVTGIARALGAEGIQVSAAAELETALPQVLSLGRPVVLAVPVDPAAHAALAQGAPVSGVDAGAPAPAGATVAAGTAGAAGAAG